MTSIKAYFLRIIFCAFLVSLTAAILRGKRAGRVVTLCGGCLLILTAVRPLLRVDLSQLPDLVTGMTRTEREAAAREKNDALLRGLVEQQTADWIDARGEELGMQITSTVTAREAEAGTFVPDQVVLRGTWTEEGRRKLAEILTQELSLPPAQQRWVGG